jgi:hypothetical protein
MRRIRIWMMLEHAFNVGSNNNFLHRIAQQVAYHAHAIGVRQLNKHGDVRTVVSERRVRWMPDPFPTEDAAVRLDFSPFGVTRDSDDKAIPARIAMSGNGCSAAPIACCGASRSSKGPTSRPARPPEWAGPKEDKTGLLFCS